MADDTPFGRLRGATDAIFHVARVKAKIITTILVLALCGAHAASASRPNVVLLMADDLGYGDVGYTGNKRVKTPTLDRMAREGIRLDRFYAGAPLCTPTRASVLTGRNGFRSRMSFPGFYPLPQQEITLGELMRTAGYRTGFFGKWHLGKMTRDGREGFKGSQPKPAEYGAPWEHGFDVCFAAEMTIPTYNPAVWDFEWLSVSDEERRYVMDRPVAYGEGTRVGKKMVPWPIQLWHEGERAPAQDIEGDSSALITDEALKFIRAAVANQQVFLAVIWYFTPHAPVAAGNEDRAKYSALKIREQHWFGAISAMDAQIGRVREELVRLGIAQDTLVHFCSDNGPSKVHELGSPGAYRGKKGDLYDGGIHVPATIAWPARLRSGVVINATISTDDLLPTIAAAAQIPLDKINRPLDGENVLPILEGRQSERLRPLHFHSHVLAKPTGERSGDIQSALIDGAWKLITVQGKPKNELFNLRDDPQETTDLASREPARVEQMTSVLQAGYDSMTASARGDDYRE